MAELLVTSIVDGHWHSYDPDKSGRTGPVNELEGEHQHFYAIGSRTTAKSGFPDHSHSLSRRELSVQKRIDKTVGTGYQAAVQKVIDKAAHSRRRRRQHKACADCSTPTLCKTNGSCAMEKSAFTFTAKIEKIDEDKRQVFGWFSVIEENGTEVQDREGDIIQVEELEKAAYNFVVNARKAGEMHKVVEVGQLIESMVFSKDKQEALGIDLGKVGWWGGFQITDNEVWSKIKDGTYSAFSIGGSGRRTDAA